MLSERQTNSPSSRQRTSASQSSFTARCFVPETLIDYINDHVEGELKPASFFLHGVCLLVDISGFTKLSGAFCAQGKDGIDGLQLATNGFMGKLVEIIYSFGGDIIKFAGDAIICIFYSKVRPVKNETKPIITLAQSTSGKAKRVDSNSSRESDAQSPERRLSLKPVHDNSADMADMFSSPHEQSHRLLTATQVQPEIVLKAIRCALELRDVETSKLTVHVAMSCGEMCFGILGGHENRFECLVSGACLHQLSDCLDDAPSKHAALTAGCHDVLRLHSQMMALDTKVSESNREYDYLSQVQLERLHSGNYMILSAESRDGFSTEYLTATPRSTPLPTLVTHFVPVPISSGLEHTAGLSYLAEIREVTTMFMKWESYDASSEHADLIRLQVHFHQTQKILHTTGAFLRQFLVDDKGCVLIACWGMPSLSYLDNSHRALSAAAQIRNKLGKINMKCSFGITTGDVYCGTVGSSLRMEYAAIGNVVNMSARLMGKADEDILIDRETYTRLPDAVQKSLETLDPIRVKGREEPLQVYRYSAEGSIFIGDDVVEDHEVREVCKTTFIKLLDRMKAPGRFSVYKRRQSIVKVKEWISDSVRRGGDLLTMSTINNKMNESDTSSRKGMLRSSFQMSFRNSSRENNEGNSSRLATTPTSTQSSVHGGASSKSVRSSLQRRGSGGAYASNRNPGVYQHDDLSHRHIHEIPYVLMEGRRGAGKSSIVNWLKKQATDRQIPVYRARLSKNDVLVDYSLWMKVFRQMMPKDMFKTKALQEKYVTQLLQELYHNDLDHIEYVAFPSMQRAFGITCELELIKDKSFDLSLGDALKPRRNKLKVTSRVVTETLLKVFAHLLNEKPILIIIENVQFADEESLNVLLGLTHLHTLSAVVLTALGPDGHSGKKAVPNGIQRVDSFDSEVPIASAAEPNEWFARFRGSVLFYDHATLITLDDFSPDEIDRMLCEALNLIQVPAEISQLVQDLSGGSFFWVKEIMHFLQEHGRDEFLVAIAGGELNTEGRRSVRKSGIGGAGITSPRTSFTTMRMISQAVNFTRKAIINRVIPSALAATPTGKTTKFKLELLVVCRFEKLPVNVQHVLRTASIIGAVFPSTILYSVLPPSLQEDVQEYVEALLRQKWIIPEPDDDAQYMFTHPYAHKIIYDLTPLSERSNMHRIIAEHIEHSQGDDPAQFALLSHHNAHCNVEKAFHYTYQAINYLLDKGTAHELGQCVDLLFDSLPHIATVVDADVLRIMVYNVRRRVDELGETPNSTFTNKTAGAIMGGLYGAVSALSNRWKKTSPNSVAVSPLTIIDEGVSGKSGKTNRSSKSGKSSRAMDAAGFGVVNLSGPPLSLGSPTSAPLTTIMSGSISNTNSRDEHGFDTLANGHINSNSNSNPPGKMYSRDDLEGNHLSDFDTTTPHFASPRSDNDVGIASTPVKNRSLKVLVKRVIDGGSGGSSANQSPAKLTLSLGGSSKKERSATNNERAKVYFREKLRQLDAQIDVKVNELTTAGKFGEHKDWQHTLILCTPKKELPQSASPVRFFAKAGSATKQFFAPFFRPSDTQLSVNEHSGHHSGNHDLSGASQVVEPGAAGEMSVATAGPNNSVSKFDM